MGQYQLPMPKGPIQGPTIQPTSPIPPVSGPELNGYERVRQMNRYVVAASVYLHQGGTVLATSPIPPVSAPERRYWTEARDPNRILDGAGPTEQLDGPPRYQTSPIPPVSQPEMRYWNPRWDLNRILEGLGPIEQLDGPTRQQTYIFHSLFTWSALSKVSIDAKTPMGDEPVQATFPIPPVSGPVLPYWLRETNRYWLHPYTPLETLVPPVGFTQVFKPNQPEFRYYIPDINRYLEDNGPQEQLDGPTVQPTSPIPPVSQPELSYYFQRDVNRILEGAGPTDQYDGPISQQTFPVPPVSKAEMAYYFQRDPNRILSGIGSEVQLDGPPRQQTYVFPVNQYEKRYYVPDVNRYVEDPGPQEQFDGATSMRTDPIPPVSQPEQNGYDRLRQALRYVIPTAVERHQGATTMRTDPIPPVSGPELRSYALLNALRYITSAILPIQGATAQATFPVPPVKANPDAGSTDYARYRTGPTRVDGPAAAAPDNTVPIPGVSSIEWAYYRQADPHRVAANTGPKAQYEGPTSQQTSPIPGVSGPEMTGFERVRQALRYITAAFVDVHQGATRQQWYLFPPNQPELNAYDKRAQQNRYIVGAVPSVHQGASVQQTSPIPGVSGVEFSYYFRREPNRMPHTIGPRAQFDGAIVQQTYIFPPNQPEQNAYDQLRNIWRRMTTPAGDHRNEGSTTQQTYVFPVNQPELTRTEAVRQWLRSFTSPKPPIDQGASQQQTHPVPPVSRPEMAYYFRRDVNRLQQPGPEAQTLGRTPEHWYIYPTNQPRYAAWEPRRNTDERNATKIDWIVTFARTQMRRGVTVLSTLGQKAVLTLTGKGAATTLGTTPEKTTATTRSTKNTLTTRDNKNIL